MKINFLRNKAISALRTGDDWLYNNSKKTNILFVRTDSYGFSCLAPIIKELENISNIYLRTTNYKDIKTENLEFASKQEKDIFQKHHLSHTKAMYYKWHLIVDTHPNSFYPKRNALRIGMHHGSGFGILGSKVHFVQNYDIFFGLSKAERLFLESIEPKIFDDLAFFPIGNPKVDILADKNFNNRDLIEKFNLKYKNTILITSHWQKGSTLNIFRSQLLEMLAHSFPNYNIIQTSHPWCWNKDKQNKQEYTKLFNELKNISELYPNAYFLPFENSEQLLGLSDLLVADHSSIMTTFSLTDRPIVWFDNPEIKFAIPEIQNTYRTASHRFITLEELPKQCQQALNSPEEKAEGRKIMRKTFHANPGNAAKIAAETLQKIGTICSKKSPKWSKVMNMSNDYQNTN